MKLPLPRIPFPNAWFAQLAQPLALAALATTAWAGEVHVLELRAEGDVLRLQIETDPGTLGQASMSRDGSNVVVTLKGATPAQLGTLITQLKSRPAQVRNVSYRKLESGELELLVELREPSDVLDETIAAHGRGRVAWELVLGRYARLEELAEIELRAQGDQARLFLRGGPGLKVQASAQEEPPALILDFPQLSTQQLSKPMREFKSDGMQVRGTRLEEAGPKKSRVTILLDKPLQLAAPTVQSGRDSTSYLIAATPAPQYGPNGAIGVMVQAISTMAQAGVPMIILNGAQGVRVEARRQAQPPALLVTLDGVSGKRAAELLAEFKSTLPDILGGRLGSSSARSSQLVFDLLSPLQADPQVALDESTPGRPRQSIALVKPGAVGSLAFAPAAVTPSLPPTAAAMPPAALPAAAEPTGERRAVTPVALSGPVADAPRLPSPALELRTADSMGLMAALDLALKFEPKYLAAQKEFIAASEAIPQARAGYLPTATFDFQRNSSRQRVEPNSTSVPTERSYPLRNNTLTITQPIIKLPAVFKMQQAELAVEQARAVLLATEQDQMIRLASAYLNMLAAQDGVELARAEREATEAQFQTATVRARSGLVSSTQLFETEGRFALTQAKEIEARNNLEIARLSLKEIIGAEVKGLKPFSADFEPTLPQPVSAELWVQAALDQNLSLQVANMATEIAKLEVKRQTAGYAPSLNLVLSTGQLYQGDAFIAAQPSPGYTSRSSEASLRLTVPLFEGAMTRSLVRESSARLEKSQQEREGEALKAERLARTALLSLTASSRSIPALRKALMAQESALETKLEGFKSGLFSTVQVVDAYRLMYTAKRDFLQARYDYLLNRIKLKQSIGSFTRQDLQDLADLLD